MGFEVCELDPFYPNKMKYLLWIRGAQNIAGSHASSDIIIQIMNVYECNQRRLDSSSQSIMGNSRAFSHSCADCCEANISVA